MSLSALLVRAHDHLQSHFAQNPCAPLPVPSPFVLFFSLCDGERRAIVRHYRAASFAAAWQKAVQGSQRLASRSNKPFQWLRVDWVVDAQATTWRDLDALLAETKRNYFRHGLALDGHFEQAFLEQELNANAMLYGGSNIAHATLNRKNFLAYATSRFGQAFQHDFGPDTVVWRFSSTGVFVAQDPALAAQPGHALPHILPEASLQEPWNALPTLDSGRRQIPRLDADATYALVHSSSQFLASQVRKSGQFVYGHFPCFGRKIPTYNALRHASSLYAMLEGWELTRDAHLLVAIQRGLAYLTQHLIQDKRLPGGEQAAFLVDVGDEIKLGGNAVCLLALSKYTELTEDRRYLPLLERLALGIVHMQDPATGQFTHVLNAQDLSVKEHFRIIYYDGEAAFGLMRLYGITQDPRWLAVVEKAFEHFLTAGHWKAHDHWLSYCANELTRYKPEEKYFRFGVQNILGHLDFILQRETTFPTLLELSMAFEQMLQRIESMPEMRHLLDGFDVQKFDRALHHRAHYLLNGFFWPEFAMYFANPASVVGSFFIRHHAFRVRIDDIEHYLSGYVAYWKMLRRGARMPEPVDSPPKAVVQHAVPAAHAVAAAKEDHVAPSRPFASGPGDATEGSAPLPIKAVESFSRYLLKRSTQQAIEVSIIIPVFNRQQAIRNCLGKLQAMSYDTSRVEVIVVDDGSTDGSYDAVQAFIDGFPNLVLVRRSENSGGASAPRNNGLDLASGRWVLFVDSDDHLTAHALADAIQVAQSDASIDMVCMPYCKPKGSRRAISASAFHYPDTVAGLRFEETKLCNSLNAVGKLIKAALIAQYRIRFPVGIRVREDNWFMMKAYAISKNIAILGNSKNYYFVEDKDDASLSSLGTPPDDAVRIFLSAHDFIQAQSGLSGAEKNTLLAIYLNRYVPLIGKGRGACLTLLEKTSGGLREAMASPYASSDTKCFVQEWLDGKLP